MFVGAPQECTQRFGDYEINVKTCLQSLYAVLRWFCRVVWLLVSYITLAASLAADIVFAAVVRAKTLVRTSRGYFTIARQRCAPC